jgi:hypothetical protein
MKKYLPLLAALSVASLLGGCVIGSGSRNTTANPTLGQQLIDLKKAKDAGAITDAEYQTQRTKFLDQK